MAQQKMGLIILPGRIRRRRRKNKQFNGDVSYITKIILRN